MDAGSSASDQQDSVPQQPLPSAQSSAAASVFDDTPEGVFREALQAFYDSGTYEEYKAATLRYADSAIVRQAMETQDDQITDQQKENMLLAVKMILPVPDSIRDVQVTVADDTATLTVTVQGAERPLLVTLLRESGVWKWHQLRMSASE